MAGMKKTPTLYVYSVYILAKTAQDLQIIVLHVILSPEGLLLTTVHAYTTTMSQETQHKAVFNVVSNVTDVVDPQQIV
jgi:hypothetical protein